MIKFYLERTLRVFFLWKNIRNGLQKIKSKREIEDIDILKRSYAYLMEIYIEQIKKGTVYFVYEYVELAETI